MDLLGTHGEKIAAALDVGAIRQRVIAANMANVNTPGYKAQSVEFDAHLSRAQIKEREGVEPRQDGNTVVLEVETAELRKNAIVYRTYLSALIQEIRTMRAAIQGRSG